MASLEEIVFVSRTDDGANASRAVLISGKKGDGFLQVKFDDGTTEFVEEESCSFGEREAPAAELTGIFAASTVSSAAPAILPIPGFKTTYQVVTEGSGGAAVRAGSRVTVHAAGTVKVTGKVFWNTRDPGQRPFSYQAGVGGVIVGWDQGCLGMAVGEVRNQHRAALRTLASHNARLDLERRTDLSTDRACDVASALLLPPSAGAQA